MGFEQSTEEIELDLAIARAPKETLAELELSFPGNLEGILRDMEIGNDDEVLKDK